MHCFDCPRNLGCNSIDSPVDEGVVGSYVCRLVVEIKKQGDNAGNQEYDERSDDFFLLAVVAVFFFFLFPYYSVKKRRLFVCKRQVCSGGVDQACVRASHVV